MKAESMQSPANKFKITIKDKYNVEVEFFANIQEKQKKQNTQDNSEELITVYEYNYYRITIRNRPNLSEQIENNYDEWLQYAISLDPSEYVPSDLEIAKAQYREYSVLDTPLNFEKMETQGILAEYKTMMNELETIIDTLTTTSVSKVSGYSSIVLPKPSKNLIDFKNKFNKLF